MVKIINMDLRIGLITLLMHWHATKIDCDLLILFLIGKHVIKIICDHFYNIRHIARQTDSIIAIVLAVVIVPLNDRKCCSHCHNGVKCNKRLRNAPFIQRVHSNAPFIRRIKLGTSAAGLAWQNWLSC